MWGCRGCDPHPLGVGDANAEHPLHKGRGDFVSAARRFAEIVALLVTVNVPFLRLDLDPVGLTVVRGRRRRVRTKRGGDHRLRRHGLQRLIGQIGDEHAGLGEFLAGQLREVDMPEVFEARR